MISVIMEDDYCSSILEKHPVFVSFHFSEKGPSLGIRTATKE